MIACRHVLATPQGVGAIAVIRLRGPGAAAVLARVAPRAAGARPGAIVHADLAGVDDGLVVRENEAAWTLMPHGGPALVRGLLAALEAAGSVAGPGLGASAGFARPRSLEAAVAATLATAASPAAVDLLAAQPALWRAALLGADSATEHFAGVASRSRWLDRLLTPPRVVVAGRPNAGKSTLLNRLAGEAAARVSPEPGTTRDWVGRRVALTPSGQDALADAVVVDWCDTPGLRAARGVEARAIELAAEVLRGADLLIELVAPGEGRLGPGQLPREPDLVVESKADTRRATDEARLCLSAATGEGVDEFVDEVIERLVPAEHRRGLWAFEPVTRAWATGRAGRAPRRWLRGGSPREARVVSTVWP